MTTDRLTIEQIRQIASERRHQKALRRFAELKAEIDARLERLQGASDDHFDTHPDDVNWGHVGDLASINDKLRELTDQIFHEGEHAEVA